MQSQSNVTVEVHLEDDVDSGTMDQEVRDGLTSTPKSLPSKYFYDERGSRLFEQITRVPEYYLTHAEQTLLDRFGEKIARITRFEELIELGSGAAKKTRALIDAGLGEGSLRRYVPMEVSREIAERTAHGLAERYPDLAIHVVVGDFDHHMDELPHGGRRLVAMLGSTIGNFDEDDAVGFLGKVEVLLDPGDWLLLGTDLVKPAAVLEAAYNDSQGVTAEFNRNILEVLNRNLDGDFDPSAFEHVSRYNAERERIESFLRSRRDQRVRLDSIDLEIGFDAGELLSTEVSCKYTRESAERILRRAGLRLEHWLTDETRRFALSLSRLDG